MDRRRFLSAWSSLALIVMFSGIFLDITILGFSTITVAIFMWIVGGAIATIIFGDSSDKASQDLSPTNCPSCGLPLTPNDQFCKDCGLALNK